MGPGGADGHREGRPPAPGPPLRPPGHPDRERRVPVCAEWGGARPLPLSPGRFEARSRDCLWGRRDTPVAAALMGLVYVFHFVF